MAVVVKTVLGSHFGVGEFTTHFRTYYYFSGWIGMFTETNRDFDPWPIVLLGFVEGNQGLPSQNRHAHIHTNYKPTDQWLQAGSRAKEAASELTHLTSFSSFQTSEVIDSTWGGYGGSPNSASREQGNLCNFHGLWLFYLQNVNGIHRAIGNCPS